MMKTLKEFLTEAVNIYKSIGAFNSELAKNPDFKNKILQTKFRKALFDYLEDAKGLVVSKESEMKIEVTAKKSDTLTIHGYFTPAKNSKSKDIKFYEKEVKYSQKEEQFWCQGCGWQRELDSLFEFITEDIDNLWYDVTYDYVLENPEN